MDPRLIDLTGQYFGAWLVLSYDGKQRFLCECRCGTRKVVKSQSLRIGLSRSCGCLRGTAISLAKTTHGHGGSSARGIKYSRTYATWVGMRARCENPKRFAYERYGGRGITVCERWSSSFENFLADMGEAPAGLSIDRIDNDLGYFKGNCRWATAKEQANNRKPRDLGDTCRHGHPRTPENTGIGSNGARYCRKCSALCTARLRARKKCAPLTSSAPPTSAARESRGILNS